MLNAETHEESSPSSDRQISINKTISTIKIVSLIAESKLKLVDNALLLDQWQRTQGMSRDALPANGVPAGNCTLYSTKVICS